MKLFCLFLTLAHSKNFKLKVIGGVEVTPAHKYNFIVAIYKNGEMACGGTLYNKNTVITAAHCVRDGEIGNYTILYHRHNRNLTSEAESGKTVKLIKRINSPTFDHNKNLADDISIWKIEPIEDYIPTIKLDYENKYGNNVGSELIVAGWGISDDGKPSNKLIELNIPVYDTNKCVENYKNMIKIEPEGAICAGYENGDKDSCSGDSGGPLFTFSYGVPTLVGIVSQGYGCALAGFPGIYTRVSKHIPFILQNS